MNKYTLILLTILGIANSLLGQIPNIQWQKSLGGSGNEIGGVICQTSDGGFIISSYSNSNNGDVSGNHGNYDYWIIKLDSMGIIQWQKSLGGTRHDNPSNIIQTIDGGYIVAGGTESNDGDVTGHHSNSGINCVDAWVVKLDINGNIQWQKTLGGTSNDFLGTILQTTDGGYIIAGLSASIDGDVTGNHGGSDYWIVKLDSTGFLQWQKSLGGSQDDWASSIAQTTDGGYILTGNTSSNDGDVTFNHSIYIFDIWIVKIDSIGNLQWQRSLGGTDEDYGLKIIQSSDGGYLLTGNLASLDGDVTAPLGGGDFWIVKLDSSGNLVWERSIGGSGNDLGISIIQPTGGGFILAGRSNSIDGDVTGNHGSSDYWIIKIDSLGMLLWQKSLGGRQSDQALSIIQASDGNYLVGGYSDSNTGNVTGNNGAIDLWIVKLGLGGTGIVEDFKNQITIYPNPTNDYIILTVDESLIGKTFVIVNHLGQAVSEGVLDSKDIKISLISFSTGLYTMIIAGQKKHSFKILKE